MKRFITLFLVIFFISCSDDDCTCIGLFENNLTGAILRGANVNCDDGTDAGNGTLLDLSFPGETGPIFPIVYLGCEP